MKVGILIPSTSKGRSWNTVSESLLYKTLDSFRTTICKEHTYTFYIGYDTDDPFYREHEYDCAWSPVEPQLDLCFVKLAVEKGWLTRMWNILAKKAYEDGCDYLYQCGDDITFTKKGWVSASIAALQSRLGITGPKNTNGNVTILTQAFAHRTHVEHFGWFFPEEIKNWYCDDWINGVYPKNWLDDSFTCVNEGGEERYAITHCKELCDRLIARDRLPS
jgi:hypothetical protein